MSRKAQHAISRKFKVLNYANEFGNISKMPVVTVNATIPLLE
jgi:hypothetical protein